MTHAIFEKALLSLKDSGFAMDTILVTTWRNTLSNQSEFEWLTKTLEKYGVPIDNGNFGLYMAPEDAHDPSVFGYAMETFRRGIGRYPFFVAGMSASLKTYLQLVDYGVKLSFFNLWEEGEDYSYRGYRTGDRIFGANWEGSPFQPYKPSKRTANAPGLTKKDELDIWEAHWITRNPSYAFLVINSRNLGSIHPHDLLWADGLGTRRCSPSYALEKFRLILDLIDFNAGFNPIMVVSYPVEVSLLIKYDVFEVWQASMREFMRRGYKFVDAVRLRGMLDSLKPEYPHTPTYLWFDNLTSSDLVVAGEHTPFIMLSSPYGRFIYARRDPLKDSGTVLISITSYKTARAFNESFQSIRELTGAGLFKMNTYVNEVPIDMRWLNDISTITLKSEVAAIKWIYSKGEASHIMHSMLTYLTPYGVLIEKEIIFTKSVAAKISIVHYFTVQRNSPVQPIDGGVWVET
ncbi:hypothetical protein KEJ17_02105, partial [Candidatus Bathyarchaeota archaeon]|nr:hypothetical protein [Candidatus Bathyarchaeota archaeon]